MKKINFILSSILIVVALSTQGCSTKANKKEAEKSSCCSKAETKMEASCCADSIKSIDTSKTTALYFHAKRRCATCEAVEAVTKEALKEYYKGEIKFYSINREEDKELAKKYNIEWQALIIVKGDEIINLTNDAFLNARTNPDKLKAKLKSTIDQMK